MDQFEIQLKRASILSDVVYGLNPTIPQKRPSQSEVPKDRFALAALFSFFSGVAGVIPMSFFVTANDYWMYKLRDISYETYDLNNKTFLQKMFMSMNSIGTAIPSVISILFTLFYAYKIKPRIRFLVCLGVTSIMFIVFTSLVEVNTDSWQTAFFILSLIVLGLIALVSPVFAMTNLTFLAKFPTQYMMLNMIGTAIGGLFSSSLQVICLSIGNNSTQVAMIYFSSGTAVMCFTFILLYMTKYSPLIEFYSSNNVEGPKIQYTFREYIKTVKNLWPLITMMFMSSIIRPWSHPNITSLVVSERYVKDGDNLWYDKYFVSVATFLAYDIFQLLGRFFARPFINKKNYGWFLSINVLAVLSSTLLLFCNTHPRKNLPVWFPHDYQYMLIHFIHSFFFSILVTAKFLSIPNFAEGNPEMAYTVILTIMLATAFILSPLNSVFVTIL